MLSTSYSLTAEINRQATLESQIAQLQTNISSGVQVHVASDDPLAAAQIATIGRQQANESVYTANVKVAQATTSLVDTNLTGVQTSLNRAKELMLEASNGTMNDSDRTAAITELQGIASDLDSAANQTDVSGNPLFVKGTAATQIPIGNGTTVAAGDSYDEVFGSVTLKDGSTTSIASVLAASIAALQTTDPTAIAAASSAGTNGNLLNLSSLRGSTGIEQSWSGMVTDQGQIVASANTAQTAADATKSAAFSARDQTSGVDLDTEAAELLRYQQAYSGAAKVIQTAKDTMQSILDLF